MGALPASVCPYTPEAGHDRECPGIDSARVSNPLQFTVKKMSTYYEREAVKSALREGRVLALSTSMITNRYLLPCTEETSKV